MKLTVRIFPLFFLLVALLSGCGGGGGGGGGGTSVTRTAPAKVTVHWAERGRGVTAPAAALSLVVRLAAASATGEDITFIINRDSSPAAHITNHVSPTPARIGSWRMSVTFYSAGDGSGSVVGTATGDVTMAADGDLPDLLTSGRIASIFVLPSQVVPVGLTLDPQISAQDANGNLIAISPGSARLNVTAGASFGQVTAGLLTGLYPGLVTLTAQMDDLGSLPQGVKVTSNALVQVSPGDAQVSISGQMTFTANVLNAPSNAVTWSVQEGANAGTITADGLYTAPATPGDYHLIATSQYDPDKKTVVHIGVVSGGLSVGGDFPPSGGVGVSIN